MDKTEKRDLIETLVISIIVGGILIGFLIPYNINRDKAIQIVMDKRNSDYLLEQVKANSMMLNKATKKGYGIDEKANIWKVEYRESFQTTQVIYVDINTGTEYLFKGFEECE